MENIIKYANHVSTVYDVPVYMLGFKRTLKSIEDFKIDLGVIQVQELLPFKKYIETIYHAKVLISDSGTAQEEPALLDTPVIVPRDYTERPESVLHGSSFMIDVNTENNATWVNSHIYLIGYNEGHPQWLGNGNTSQQIIDILKEKLWKYRL